MSLKTDISLSNNLPGELPSLNGEEIVISGISGIFPSSNSVHQFMENLYNKVDMVTAVEPSYKLAEMPKHKGMLEGLEKFDAQFFRVTFNQANYMDPVIRKLMEHAYSAIYDAGINPLTYDTKKLGVFVGQQYSDSALNLFGNNVSNRFFLTGCSKSMTANRVSYCLNGKGPSYAADYSCSSSLACLEQAYNSIISGRCDSAIVGSGNAWALPKLTVNLSRAGLLCPDGKTKCFDKHGDGYVRSEAVNVLFLQKAKDAKRIYSEIHYAQMRYTLKEGEQFFPIRNVTNEIQFFQEFYTNINISPDDVEYVEANGSGLSKADANEIEAIGRFFGAKSPIKIGCVKSNMGNTESAAGLCAITKVCLAYHTGKLPGNLHYKEPLDIPSINEDKVKIVQDTSPFKRGFTAINSISYSGIDAHVLLKGHYKAKDKNRYLCNIPYLVPVSARQEECVDNFLLNLESRPVDPELISLVHDIHHFKIANHIGRGYVILDTNEKGETVTLARNFSYYGGETRPVCFMYSGMGSQWPGMGADLMRIPIFNKAIMKCHQILSTKGVDIVKIISDIDKNMFDNILYSFIGIAAVQIALTDILKELGIVPDLIIGHSVGELGCAYADGCFSAEETILASYSRGIASLESDCIPGAMAAVGLGFNEIVDLVPPEIDVACHNSFESSTISGPAEKVRNFVKVLKSRGVFAKEVPCGGISYHSRYIKVAGPRLMKELKSVIKNCKPRSKKWLSTSVLKEKWNTAIAQFSSPEYHVNNLLNPVYFEETTKLIPSNAVIIEIAPHGLLQAILKRSHSKCSNISLTKRGNSNSVTFLLQALGKLFERGLNPKVSNLYPKVEYPVSSETPLLSHLVKWNYSENWLIMQDHQKRKITTGYRQLYITIHDEDYNFLKGHVRNGVNIFPESALLVIVWQTLAMSFGINYRCVPVTFTNVHFEDQVTIDPEDTIKLTIDVIKNGGRFEVYCDDTQVVSGYINTAEDGSEILTEDCSFNDDAPTLLLHDVYKLLSLRGYSYKDEFQSIYLTNFDGDKGTIKWTNEWITFIDALIQLNILANDNDEMSTPKLIAKLIIDPFKHNMCKQHIFGDNICLNATLNKSHGLTRCGGVEIKNITFQSIPLPRYVPGVLNDQVFCEYFPTNVCELEKALFIHLQIINENVMKDKLNVFEQHSVSETSIVEHIRKVSKFIGTDVKINYIPRTKHVICSEQADDTSDVFITCDLFGDEQEMSELKNHSGSDTFVLALEDTKNVKGMLTNKYFIIISAINVSKNKAILLLRKRQDAKETGATSYITVDSHQKWSWIEKVHLDMRSKKHVILVVINQSLNGISGIVKALNREYGKRLRLVTIDDCNAPKFDQENVVYREQIQNRLVFNVLHKGKWGGFYDVPVKQDVKCKDKALVIDVPGNFDTFKWCENLINKNSSRKIKVHYAGASQRDYNIAMGIETTKQDVPGMEFSGIDNNGNRVMGLIPGGAIADTIEADPNLLWPVPEHWTMKEASTVPLAFAHAYYCLAIRAKLYKGAPVVVAGGAGALGQAVIALCLTYGHKVYTTVSNIEKKKYLLRLFPDLKENQIYNSKSMYSALLIRNDLKDTPCSVVIYCNSGISRQEFMHCVGPMGYFLDVCKVDVRKNKDLGMRFLVQCRSYIAVDFSNIFNPKSEMQRRELQLLVSDGIAKGVVRPLTYVTYPPEKISRAFQFLSSRKHIGKVLINLQNLDKQHFTKISSRITCSSTNSYITICDKNEFGLEVINMLVRRGVKKVVIHLTEGKISGYGNSKIESWKKQGVHVELVFEDLKTEKGCSIIFNEAMRMGPIEGIFIIFNSTEQNPNNNIIDEKLLDKANELASRVVNMERTSRYSVGDTLRYFAVITQSSRNICDEYVNSVSEEICRARHAVGLPGLVFRAGFLNQHSKPIENSNLAFSRNNIFKFCSGLERSLRLQLNNVQSFHWQQETDLDSSSDGQAADVEIVNEKHIVTRCFSTTKNGRPDIKSAKTNFKSGMAAFYSFIDVDFYRATEPIVLMRTAVVNTFSEPDELDPHTNYLMLVPGFDGHYTTLKFLCQKLKMNAFTIQLDPDMKHDSIREMAENIFKVLKRRLIFKEKFYLLGYSFGVNIALELTSMMEKEGHVGTVYCLDSSPDVLRDQLESYIGELSDVQLQNSIIEHMFNLLIGRKRTANNENLEATNNWEKKIDCFIHEVKKSVNISHQYIRCFIDSAYKKIILARNYDPTYKLNSQLVLLRGIPHPNSKTLPHDYYLSKYSKNDVKVFEIESDIVLAPYDNRVTNIINRILGPEELKKFENSSACEVYFNNIPNGNLENIFLER